MGNLLSLDPKIHGLRTHTKIFGRFFDGQRDFMGDNRSWPSILREFIHRENLGDQGDKIVIIRWISPSRNLADYSFFGAVFHGSTICIAGGLKRGLNTVGLPGEMALDSGFELVDGSPSEDVWML